jgi:hypothetical protein
VLLDSCYAAIFDSMTMSKTFLFILFIARLPVERLLTRTSTYEGASFSYNLFYVK